MARFVREIMNSELFSVRLDAHKEDALDALLEFGITAVPVLDDERICPSKRPPKRSGPFGSPAGRWRSSSAMRS